MLPAGRIAEALEAMQRMIRAGALSDLVRDELHAQAAAQRQRTGRNEPDRRELLAALYGELLEAFVYVDDPDGSELVQAPDVTLRRGGDCSSATVLVLSFARGLGLRTRLAVVVTPEEDGGGRASHVFGEAETSRGTWEPLDLAEGMPFGQAHELPEGAYLERYPVLPSGPGLGFLDGLFSAVAGIFQADATRDAAREATDQARIVAQSTRDAAETQARAAANQTQGAVDVATINALASLGAQRQASATVGRVLDFLKSVGPTVAALAALKAVVPVLVGRRAA